MLTQNEKGVPMSKTTMQDIADALGISRVTVWKVFKNQSGVSSSLRENVLNKAKEMGYSKISLPAASEETDAGDNEKTVSLIISRPDSSTFWTNIIHRMAQELSYHNVNMMYTYMPSAYTDSFIMPAILSSGDIQGAIILNVYDLELIRLINELDLPKVFLDTVPQMDPRMLHGDLILLESFDSIYQITRSVIDRGLTHLGFIGDIQYARTNLDRYKGFCQCMADHHLEIDETVCLTHSIGIFSYYHVLCSFLDSLDTLPQAFVCANDYIAHFLHLYFTEHADRIPRGILVTGYDGSHEYSNIDELITTADVKTSLLGKRLSMQVIYRMENTDAPYELAYINPEVIYRDSVIY